MLSNGKSLGITKGFISCWASQLLTRRVFYGHGSVFSSSSRNSNGNSFCNSATWFFPPLSLLVESERFNRIVNNLKRLPLILDMKKEDGFRQGVSKSRSYAFKNTSSKVLTARRLHIDLKPKSDTVSLPEERRWQKRIVKKLAGVFFLKGEMEEMPLNSLYRKIYE